MPVTEGLRKTEGMLRDAEGDLVLEANLLGFLASFEAMQGRIEEARAHIVESAERLNDLGLRWQAGVQELLRGYIELLAGDPVAADRFMRAAKESFIAIGDKLFLSTVAVDLPRPALERGRHEEARALVDAIEEVPAVEIEWVIKRASVRARILAIDGKTDEAESLAREAVAIATETDLLNFHAGALIDLAEVLRGAGHFKEAGDAADEALVLYERKGNVMSAAKTRALVAELEGARE
jgi:tetratricopeptide (TPR) repeat protein